MPQKTLKLKRKKPKKSRPFLSGIMAKKASKTRVSGSSGHKGWREFLELCALAQGVGMRHSMGENGTSGCSLAGAMEQQVS